MDKAKDVSFISVLNFICKQSNMHVAGRNVLQKYLGGMKLCFIEPLTRGGFESGRVNGGPLGRVLETANALSFRGSKNQLAFMVIFSPSIIPWPLGL